MRLGHALRWRAVADIPSTSAIADLLPSLMSRRSERGKVLGENSGGSEERDRPGEHGEGGGEEDDGGARGEEEAEAEDEGDEDEGVVDERKKRRWR